MGAFYWAQLLCLYYGWPSNTQYWFWCTQKLYILNGMQKISYTLQLTESKYLKCILVLLNYIKLIRTDVCHYFNYVWSSFKIMCTALIVLLLGKMKLPAHYISLLHITLTTFKHLLISVRSENRRSHSRLSVFSLGF